MWFEKPVSAAEIIISQLLLNLVTWVLALRPICLAVILFRTDWKVSVVLRPCVPSNCTFRWDTSQQPSARKVPSGGNLVLWFRILEESLFRFEMIPAYLSQENLCQKYFFFFFFKSMAKGRLNLKSVSGPLQTPTSGSVSNSLQFELSCSLSKENGLRSFNFKFSCI